jgi:hypothetical protein
MVGEGIDVEDLGGGVGRWADGAVRSQVREESSGEGSGGVLDFEEGLLLSRRI